MAKPLSVYVIAGEASGDLLGGGLMASLKAQANGAVRFSGVGGERMEAQGLTSLFPYHELSLMGFAEVVPHAVKLLARVRLVVEDIRIKKPDVVVTIDSPGFNFRVAKQLQAERKEGMKLVHYVAPSVWAYKPERAQKCAKLFDHMLTLLPFEPKYFLDAGLPTTFTGHPVAYQEKGDGVAFRAKHNIAPDVPLICLLPGSRETEIKRHLAEFGVAVRLLADRHPNLAMVVPVNARFLPLVSLYFQGCPFRAILTGDMSERILAFAASDVALVKSGTVSLEVARAGAPQIVAYRTGRITAWLVKRMVNIPYVNLINIMQKREVIPEFIQEHCNVENLTNALETLLSSPDVAEAQRKAAAESLEQMKVPGMHASDAAAKQILRTVGKESPQ